MIKEESCETDYDGISDGNYSGFHSEFVDVKEEPSVNSHVPNAFQGGNDLHSYIFNASLPQHPTEDFSRYVFQIHSLVTIVKYAAFAIRILLTLAVIVNKKTDYKR